MTRSRKCSGKSCCFVGGKSIRFDLLVDCLLPQMTFSCFVVSGQSSREDHDVFLFVGLRHLCVLCTFVIAASLYEKVTSTDMLITRVADP